MISSTLGELCPFKCSHHIMRFTASFSAVSSLYAMLCTSVHMLDVSASLWSLSVSTAHDVVLSTGKFKPLSSAPGSFLAPDHMVSIVDVVN